VLYTDAQDDMSEDWLVVREPYHVRSKTLWPGLYSGGRHSWDEIDSGYVRSLMAAKFYKMNMCWLPEVEGIEMIFWHDANWHGADAPWSGTDPIADRCRQALQGYHMVVDAHPRRHKVKDELSPAAERANATCCDASAYEDVQEAWDHQQHLGFTDTVGLFQLNRFILNSSAPGLRPAFVAWWHEVQNFTYRDQISFPFIVQQFHLTLNVKHSAGSLLQES